jgi:hypothetical protein
MELINKTNKLLYDISSFHDGEHGRVSLVGINADWNCG